jgi:DNA repair protein RadC
MAEDRHGPEEQDPLLNRFDKLTGVVEDLTKELQKKATGSDDAKAKKAFDFLKSDRAKAVVNDIRSGFSKIPFGDLMFNQISAAASKPGLFQGLIKSMEAVVEKSGALVAIIALAASRWFKLDAAAEAFRKSTGISASQMQLIRAEVERINIAYKAMGIKAEDVYKSAAAFVNEFKSIGTLSRDMMETSALLAANYGVGEDKTAAIFKNMIGIGRQSMVTAKNLIASAGAWAKMAGIPVNKVMEDLASSSEEVYLNTRGIPENMLRASVHARSLGLSLDEMAKTTSKMLNFQESIDAELNASILLNRELNFMEARRLSFLGDTAGAMDKIIEQMDRIGDLSKLNPIQMKAFAEAAGMTVEQLVRINATRNIERQILNGTNQQEKKRLENIQAARKAMEASLDISKQTADQFLKQQEMQAVQTQLMNALKDIALDIAEILLPIVSLVMAILRPIFAFVKGVMSPLKDIGNLFRDLTGSSQDYEKMMQKIVGWAEALGMWFGRALMLVNALIVPFAAVVSIIAKITKGVGFFATLFSGLGAWVGTVGRLFGFLGAFGKLIPIIGWIITAVQFVINLFSRFGKLMDSDEWKNANIGERILLGLKAVVGAIFDTLIQPFVDVWNWLSKTIMGESPSQLGLGIVDGIKSVGTMIFDALFWPFKTTWELIKGLFTGKNFGQILMNMFNALPAPLRWMVDKITGGRMSSLQTENAVVEAGGTASSKVSVVEAATEAGASTNEIITAKLDELINLMRNGGIAVNIDGKRANELISERA